MKDPTKLSRSPSTGLRGTSYVISTLQLSKMPQMLTSRYKGRIHDIDVKANHDRPITDSVFNLLCDPVNPKVIQIESMDKIKSCSHIIFQILGALMVTVNILKFLVLITYPKAGPYTSMDG